VFFREEGPVRQDKSVVSSKNPTWKRHAAIETAALRRCELPFPNPYENDDNETDSEMDEDPDGVVFENDVLPTVKDADEDGPPFPPPQVAPTSEGEVYNPKQVVVAHTNHAKPKFDQDAVPAMYYWRWDKSLKAFVSQPHPRVTIAGMFFRLKSQRPLPLARQRLLQLLMTRSLTPITLNFLRTELVPRLNRVHPVSLRLLHWLLVDMSQHRHIAYKWRVGTRWHLVVLHELYAYMRTRFKRNRFDCFRRRHRVYFQLDGKVHSTTVAQLHFFYVAHSFGVLQYASRNVAAIKADMEAFLATQAAKKKKQSVPSEPMSLLEPSAKTRSPWLFACQAPLLVQPFVT
jgi:hypothetical protein